jgi:hypothetical protein
MVLNQEGPKAERLINSESGGATPTGLGFGVHIILYIHPQQLTLADTPCQLLFSDRSPSRTPTAAPLPPPWGQTSGPAVDRPRAYWRVTKATRVPTQALRQAGWDHDCPWRQPHRQRRAARG